MSLLQKTSPCKLLTSPRRGEVSETVCSPTLMTFLIDDNVYCIPL